MFDAAAFVEQPFAEGRGSVSLAGRYSYTQALLSLVAPDYTLGYGDYQIRAAYNLSERDKISLFAFGANDELGNDKTAKKLFDVGFGRVDLRYDRTTEDSRTRLAVTFGTDSQLNADENTTNPGSYRRSRGLRLRMETDQRVARRVRLIDAREALLCGSVARKTDGGSKAKRREQPASSRQGDAAQSYSQTYGF
ncbi:MAG TPA: hypothetical protein VJT73_03280 [Polyangiaceae bacterium]|nr:hypothetical protein [Polyangiaceae bacterium]